MQTTIAESLLDNPHAIAAQEVLRKCVHCGFCLATCPTYNILGDEKDSPRGRIYLIKQVVEGHIPSQTTQTHLDRCLTCRNCETTCPSGVEYGRLLDAGRALVEQQVSRSAKVRWLRKLILWVLPYRKRVTPLVRLGQTFRAWMPAALASSVPARQTVAELPTERHDRHMLVLDGCVQPSMAPASNVSAARVLNAFGITLNTEEASGCCGAVHFHLNAQTDARDFMRRNIDAWWPSVEDGCEAIITTASGCGVMVKDYGHVLADDPVYAAKASRVSELSRDIIEVLTEVLTGEDLSGYQEAANAMGKIAFHPPCTLQHGQKLPQITENLLSKLGFNLSAIPDSHTCCGSAGTYSIFQPELSRTLRDNKVKAVLSGQPDIIATANIGCQLHIQSGSGRPVVHWIELVDELVNEKRAAVI